MSLKRAVVVAALTVIPTATTAFAQEPDAALRRPFRGLFGAPANPQAPQSLILSASLFAAYDNNDVQGLVDDQTNTPWLIHSGAYQGANVGLDYAFSKVGQRVNFGGHLGGRLSYYRRTDRSRLLPSNGADVSLGWRLTSKLTFSARQSASYTSNYNRTLARGFARDLVDDIALPEDDGFDLFELRAVRLASLVGLSQTIGRYASLSGTYQLRQVEILDSDVPDTQFDDRKSQIGTVSLQYSRPMTRHATLALGYALRGSDNQRSGGEPQLLHNVNAGVNYGRALSFSRRTSLSFSTGSAIAVLDRVDDAAVQDRRTRAYLTGNAALVHEIGRSWTATLGYSRALRSWDELDQLYFTQDLSLRLAGLFSRRLSFSTAAWWADSSLQNQRGGTHRGYAANARAQYALARLLAVYAQYNYYHYRFSDALAVADRFPRQLDRQGVRVGLTTYVPLMR
jgi:opacity protein-like surface antigen